MGEVVVAKIIIEKGAKIKEIAEYCKGVLPKYKNPVKYEVVKYIERTYNGKIRRIIHE